GRQMFPVVGIGLVDPELRIGKPSFRRETEQLFCPAADEEKASRAVRLPENRAQPLDEIPIALLCRSHGLEKESALCLLAFGDVVGHALQEQRTAGVVFDQARFAPDPDDVSVAGEETALRTERTAGAAASREFFVPESAIVGMKLRVPEEGIFEPFLLRETEHRLDVRADV